MNWVSLWAKVNLGVARLIHLIRVPFRRSRGVLEWTNAVRAEGLGPTALESWTGEEGISGCIGCGLCPEKRDERALLQAGTRNIGDISPQASVEFTPEFVQYLATECPAGVSAEAIGQWLENSHKEHQ